MGARMKTSIAPAMRPDDEDNSLKGANVAEYPRRKANRRKEPVPLAPRKQQARENIESSDDELTPEQRIARMAQARYEQSAAIDAAAALAFVSRGKAPLTGEALRLKRKVSMTADVWDEIIVRVAEGESLFKVCEDAHIPHRTYIYKCLSEDAQKRIDYDAAVMLQADKRAEQIVELSELGRARAAMGASTEEMNAIKMLVNSLQWVSARMNPKKWGDKQSIDLDAKVALTEPQVDMRLAALIAKAKAKTQATE